MFRDNRDYLSLGEVMHFASSHRQLIHKNYS